jgi:hypothetical protein
MAPAVNNPPSLNKARRESGIENGEGRIIGIIYPYIISYSRQIDKIKAWSHCVKGKVKYLSS